ncbi:MAG: DUF2189 domain-containing protein [Xanthomonadales bacterium]|nr:DUF2189 domain-containing protein [Xanthomonadales bacterium]
MNEEKNQRETIPARTHIVPCRSLDTGAAFGWLRAGWVDFKNAKSISLVYGLFVFLVSIFVAFLAWKLGGFVLLFTALSGFVFVAPMLAFGLYSVSRQLCEGKTPDLAHTIKAIKRPLGNSMVYTLVLLVVFLLWTRAGMMVQVFFPLGGKPEWGHIISFLLIGSGVGSIFATFSFAASVFSLPMLANRDIDVITAVISSINGVLRNKPAMFVWAILICSLTLVGFVTAGIGLIFIIPWLAYATWHGYRAALDVSEWSKLPEEGPEQV